MTVPGIGPIIPSAMIDAIGTGEVRSGGLVVLAKLGARAVGTLWAQIWIEAAKKRLHHNVFAIALANKLARIAWAVLNKGRTFACADADAVASRPA